MTLRQAGASARLRQLRMEAMYTARMGEARDIRMTLAVARLLRQFLSDPAQRRYGYDLQRSTGLSSGTMYRALWRLTEAGWLSSHREAAGATVTRGKRTRTLPPRTYYVLTAEGAHRAQAAVAALADMLAVAGRPGGRAL